MLTALRLEVLKVIWKPRTYIGPASISLLAGLILISMKYGREFRHIEDRLSNDFYMTGTIVNAAFMTRFMLLEFIVYMLLPMFVCIVFGDLLASEAADGTLRSMLCRPVTRMRVLLSKYIVGSAYAVGLTLGTGLLAFLLGWIFLGRGSLVHFSDGIWILPERMAILRLVTAYGLVAAGMVAVGSMAFTISTVLSNSNGAIAGAMGIVIGSGIIGQIEYFERLRPYLLTTYLQVGRFIVDRPDMHLYGKSMLVMLIYSAVALVIGMIIFQRRDVLS